MGFIKVSCPSCGANIDFDDSREFGFCNYCGTKIVQEKIVVEHRGSVSIDRSNEIINLLRRAQEMFEKGLYKDSEIYFNRVLDIDINNDVARKGLDLCYKALYEPNITLVREHSKTWNNKDPLSINIDGNTVASILPNSPKSLRLDVGTHLIRAYSSNMYAMSSSMNARAAANSMNGTGTKPLVLTIQNPFQRINITFKAKLLGKVDIEIN